MEIKKESLKKAIEKAMEDKGKRKFKQSVEIIFNFRGIDFSKPENRVNLYIRLPKGRGKQNKVAVIGDEATLHKAKKSGADLTISPDELPEIAKDKRKAKKLANEYIFLAQPQFIGVVAKNLGRILGPRGKTPKPLVGDVERAIKEAKDSVRIRTSGKYMPTLQTLIGTEDMSIDDLLENAEAVIDKLKQKVQMNYLKSAYVKLTMGKPAKV